MRSFFCARLSLRPGQRRHQCDILRDQGLETLTISGVVGHHFGLFAWDVTSNWFALLAALKTVVRPIRSLAHDTEFARFHAFDSGNLFEE